MASPYRSSSGADEVRAWCRKALASWTLPHETHVFDTSLGETQVVSAGDGILICVYLPGTNFNASTSTAVLGALASGCRVYAADLPGQPGLSSSTRPDDEESGYAGWVSDLIAWVRGRHSGARIILAGHSRGAAVALSADSESVDGLVLVSPAGLIAVRPSFKMLRSTVPWLLRRNDAGARRLLEYMSGLGHTPTKDAVDWMTLVARTCRTTGAPGPVADEILERWKGREVRVAVGDQDVFFPVGRLADTCVSKLGAELLVVPGAGHLLVDEEPGFVRDLVIG